MCALSHVAASLCGVLCKCGRASSREAPGFIMQAPPTTQPLLGAGAACSRVSARGTVKKRKPKKTGGYQQGCWQVQAECTEAELGSSVTTAAGVQLVVAAAWCGSAVSLLAVQLFVAQPSCIVCSAGMRHVCMAGEDACLLQHHVPHVITPCTTVM